MKRIIFLFICFSLLTLAGSLQAQDATGANFLKLNVGPRQTGLGGAFTGVGDDVYTLYWNPAGIGFIRQWELSAMYNEYFADMYYAAISGVKQYRILGSRKTAVGAGLFYHGMPDWNSTTPHSGASNVSAGNLIGLLSFGQRMDWLLDDFSLGINVKFGYSKLASYNAKLLATDIGAMYRFEAWNRPLTLGMAVQNIGFQTAFIEQKTPIPIGVRFGASYRIFGCPWHQFLIATDVSKYKSSNYKIGFGAEYWFHGVVGVRGGYNYNQDDLGDISFGASIKMDAFNSGLQADYNQSDFGAALGYDMTGAISLNSVSPEPFRLFSPANDHLFCYGKQAMLYWENSPDPDQCDIVTYRVLIDPDERKISDAVKEVCDKPKEKASSFLDLSTTYTEILLPEIAPNDYFWTIVAVDKNGHSRWCEEIRSFKKSAPDLNIELAFLPSDTLPDFNDNFQGNLRMIIENKGLCTGYDFRVLLSDSFCCKDAINLKDEFKVDSIGPGETIRRYFSWRSDMIGKHQFNTVIDPDNNVFELSEGNNKDLCVAVTIPRGRVTAELDTLDTRKVEYTYCEVPIMPAIFFAEQSEKVAEDFYRYDLIHPYPVLKVIADRLIQDSTLNITLAGYIDPITEQGQQKLAHDRMQQVYNILVDLLGVSPDQIKLMENYDVTALRVKRKPEPKINAENRRVEIALSTEKSADAYKLFRPIVMNDQEMADNTRITDELVFKSEVKAYLDIIGSQLIVEHPTTGKALYRTPFDNEPTDSRIDLKGNAVWFGRDYEQRLVSLNHLYTYSLIIQDKLGRNFKTTPKNIFLKCDTIEEQQLQVHLNVFDSVRVYFSFSEKRLNELADTLINSPSLKIKFKGYACDIGDTSHNRYLAFDRADNIQSRFLKILGQKWEKHTGGFNEPLTFYRPCTLEEIVFSSNDAYIRNLNRRVDVILFSEKAFEEVAQDR